MPQERKILPLISIYTSKSDYESIDKDIKKEDGNDECTGINLKLYILINLLCFDFTCLMYLFFIQFFSDVHTCIKWSLTKPTPCHL